MGEPNPKRRWFHLTPDRFLLGLLAVEGFLLLSEWFCWFPFNEKKGWTVLIAVGAVLVGGLLLLLWFGVSLILRRRFQFGLRSLLAMVVVVAVACSWLGVKMQEARKQREAVEAIEKVGGYVEYYYVYDLAAGGKPHGPECLRELFGDDFFCDVHMVYFTVRILVFIAERPEPNTQVTDSEMEHLTGLTNLEILDLSYTQVTDSGLIHLKGLANLRVVNLAGTQVTDAGMVHLEGLTNLETLNLDETEVTDAGLVHLKHLTNLQYVDLLRTEVTDEGVEELRRALPNCWIHK